MVRALYLRIEKTEGFLSVPISGGYKFSKRENSELVDLQSVSLEYREVPDCKNCRVMLENLDDRECWENCPDQD